MISTSVLAGSERGARETSVVVLCITTLPPYFPTDTFRLN